MAPPPKKPKTGAEILAERKKDKTPPAPATKRSEGPAKELSMQPLLNAFRGFWIFIRPLLGEPKADGTFGASKTSVALWPVLIHCLMQWSSELPEVVKEVAKKGKEVIEETGAVDGLLDSLMSVGAGSAVPAQEFAVLLSLLGINGVVKKIWGGKDIKEKS